MKDWDKELAKIDRQIGRKLAKLPDESELPEGPPRGGGQPEEQSQSPAPTGPRRETTTGGVLARLALVTALGVGMLFWPYSARCGAGLFAYLGAVGVLIAGGAWASAWSWRHRAHKAHVLSLLLMLWGGVLGAIEVLPRVGYAIPTEMHPAVWLCG